METTPPSDVNEGPPSVDLDYFENWEPHALSLAEAHDAHEEEGFLGWLAAQWRDQRDRADRYSKRSDRLDLFLDSQGLTRAWQTFLRDHLLAGGKPDDAPAPSAPATGTYDDEAAHAALDLLFREGGREAIAALAAPQPGKLLLWCPDNGQPTRVTWHDGTVIDGWQIDLSFERIKDPDIPAASLIRVGLIVPDDPARAGVHFADAVTPRQARADAGHCGLCGREDCPGKPGTGCSPGPFEPVDIPAQAAAGHAYTSHGYPCCGQVPVGAPKGTTYRCLANRGCTTCQTETTKIHAGLPADTQPATTDAPEAPRG